MHSEIITQHTIIVLKQQLESISKFMEDPDVQEIMINGPDDVWVESMGRIFKAEGVVIDEAKIRGAIDTVASLVGKEVKDGRESGIVDARMDGFRIAAAVNGISTRGSMICIRKHSPFVWSLDDYVSKAIITSEIKEFLIEQVKGKKNILVSGGTGTGKTTFLNAMIANIPAHERIVTIEDTRELKVTVPNWVALESNVQENITINKLVKLALRLRPDRILVGEVRGAEAFDFMRALNTGHDGGYGTMHANSAMQALSTLETLILTAGIDWPLEAIRSQIGATFHYVVQLTRDGPVRKVSEIIKVNHYNHEGKKYEIEQII